MMGPVRLPSSAIPPVPASFRPCKAPQKSFVKRNLPVSPTCRGIYGHTDTQVLQNEDFAKNRGEGGTPPDGAAWVNPATETTTSDRAPYCSGGGVMPINEVPRNLPVGPNFQLNSAKPARAQAWQPLMSG